MNISKYFQSRYVHSYNTSVKSVAQLLFLKMSEHDEVINKGSLNIFFRSYMIPVFKKGREKRAMLQQLTSTTRSFFMGQLRNNILLKKIE